MVKIAVIGSKICKKVRIPLYCSTYCRLIVQLCTGRKLNGLYLWLGIRLGFHQVVFEPHPKKLTVYLVPIGNNFFPLFLFPTVNLGIKLVLFLKVWKNVVFRTWFHGIVHNYVTLSEKTLFSSWNQSNFGPCMQVQICSKSKLVVNHRIKGGTFTFSRD